MGRACRTIKSERNYFFISSFFMLSFFISSSFFMLSLAMESFFMVSLDMLSFFMPSSLPILSCAKAAGANAKLSERAAAEIPSAMRVPIVMICNPLARVESDGRRHINDVPKTVLLPANSKISAGAFFGSEAFEIVFGRRHYVIPFHRSDRRCAVHHRRISTAHKPIRLMKLSD